MFLTLLSKEVRQQLLTFRFAAALITTFALVVVSVWVLGDDYLRRRDAFNLATERGAGKNHEVNIPSQVSPTIFRPPSPLSIFAQGEDRRFGNTIQVDRWEVPREATESYSDNKLLAALLPLDLFTIFAVVVSLFGILLTYDGISGERENGTLRFMCAGLPGRGTIFGAKFLAGVICLSFPFLLSIASGLIIIVFLFGISYSPVQWLAIAIMVLGGLVYGALFVALGLTCSALVRSSSAALVLALLLWVLGVMIIPGAAQSVAGLVTPLPAATEMRKLEQSLEHEARERKRAFADKHKRYGSGWTGGWAGSGYWKFDGDVQQHSDAEEYVRFIEPLKNSQADKVWNLFREHDAARQRQASMASALSAAAPVHYLRDAFTALAGTSRSANDDFLEAARRYRREMIDGFRGRGYFGSNSLRFFSRRRLEEIGPDLFEQRLIEYRALSAQLDAKQFNQRVGIESWGPLPPGEIPVFKPPVLESDFRSAAWPLMILAVAVAIFFAFGFAVFIRYDVR